MVKFLFDRAVGRIFLSENQGKFAKVPDLAWRQGVEPVLRLALECHSEDSAHENVIVGIKGHGASVVHQVPVQIFISFE